MAPPNHQTAELLCMSDPEEEPFEHDGQLNAACVDLVKGKKWSKYPDLPCVRKWIPTSYFQNEELAKQAFMKEVKALRAAQHLHVVKLIDQYCTGRNSWEKRFNIIMDRADHDLTFYIHSQVNDSFKKRFASWFTCLARAMDYLHSMGIRHRDVKPGNILIKKEGSIEGYRILFADFGISAAGLKMTLSTTLQGRDAAKTARYAAPEVLDGGSRDSQADIFSLGAVFLEMLLAHSYWEQRPELATALAAEQGTFGNKLGEVGDLISYILGGEAENNCNDGWAVNVLTLCHWMLDENPHKRPTAAELIEKLGDPPLTDCPCNGEGDHSKNELLIESCRKDTLDDVKKRLNDGANPEEAVGAIHQAACRPGAEFVKALLDHVQREIWPKLVNQQNYAGQTPLHCAVGYGDLRTVSFLIHSGADITADDDDGDTALHCAASYGKKILVEFLLKKHRERSSQNNDKNLELMPYIDQKDRSGRTALLCAVRRGHYDVTEDLLKAGANVSLADEKKRSPLHFAAQYGCVKSVEMLLKHGADLRAKDSEKREPLYYALVGKQPEGEYRQTLNYMLKRGAKISDKDLADMFKVIDEDDSRYQFVLSAFMAREERSSAPKSAGISILSRIGKRGELSKLASRTCPKTAPKRGLRLVTTRPGEDFKEIRRGRFGGWESDVVSEQPDSGGPSRVGSWELGPLRKQPEPVTETTLAEYLRSAWQEEVPPLGSPFVDLISAAECLETENNLRWPEVRPGNVLVRWEPGGGGLGKVVLSDLEVRNRGPLHPAMDRYRIPENYRQHCGGGNTADVFVLGAVFLEIATAMARHNLNQELDAFLREHGSRSPVFAENPEGVRVWIEKLPETGCGPYGTQPLAWVEQMMTPDPDKRPSVRELRERIMQFTGGREMPAFGSGHSLPASKSLAEERPVEKVKVGDEPVKSVRRRWKAKWPAVVVLGAGLWLGLLWISLSIPSFLALKLLASS